MKISKFLVPILGLPMLMGISLNTMVSCGKDVHSFEADPWTAVVSHANQGLSHLKEWYGLDSFIGLEKTINIYGLEHKVRVIGENEDYLADSQGKPQLDKPVALTFQFSNIVSIKTDDGIISPVVLYFNDGEFANWSNSEIRAFINGEDERYESLSIRHELQQQLGDNAIKSIAKSTMFQPDVYIYESETVFLPSITDIFNVKQTKYINNSFIGEAKLNDDVYREPYSYYRQAIDQNDQSAPRYRHRVLAMSDLGGFYEPYWLRTSCVDEWAEKQSLSVSWDGIWNRSQNADVLSIAPIFCI